MKDNAELIEEYHSTKNFIDRFIFYQNHYTELIRIEPSNPLMLALTKANKLIDDEILKQRNGQKGVFYGTLTNELNVAERYKRFIGYLIGKYYKDNGIDEPIPSNDVEGGQVIEFGISRCQQGLTFEEKKKDFLESIEGKNYANEIIAEEIEILQLELNPIKRIENLKIGLSETYEVDFTKIYEFIRIENKKLKVKDPIKAITHPIFICHESLAKAIPLIQYKKFLEDHLKTLFTKSSPQAEESKEKFKKPPRIATIVWLEVAEEINKVDKFFPDLEGLSSTNKRIERAKAINQKFGTSLTEGTIKNCDSSTLITENHGVKIIELLNYYQYPMLAKAYTIANRKKDPKKSL